FRYCRSNSAFSPTYDDTILRICFVCSRRPRPQSSTPALFETQVRFCTPRLTSARIRFSGMPQRPKPPTTSVAPLGMSRTACSAESTTLLIITAKISDALTDALADSVNELHRVKRLDDDLADLVELPRGDVPWVRGGNDGLGDELRPACDQLPQNGEAVDARHHEI